MVAVRERARGSTKTCLAWRHEVFAQHRLVVRRTHRRTGHNTATATAVATAVAAAAAAAGDALDLGVVLDLLAVDLDGHIDHFHEVLVDAHKRPLDGFSGLIYSFIGVG